MLDTDTKRRIDTARDILVGKVPDPKSQVEQITIALIYKFMDDMDAEAEALGGQRTFFKGEFEQYAWPQLMSPALGGHEVLNLYSTSIQKMNINPGIPQLFRDIFKNAFLPYRDPETLKSFLKIINEFRYDHSEKLGDAFEYLLSVLGSQGEAGQFRTPRHIIDFIVDIVDPQKEDRILDVACGTAGFLISAYKHILKTNSSAYQLDTKKTASEKSATPLEPSNSNGAGAYRGDLLRPDDRRRLAENIHGYDISPDMVRLSLVNMYLHSIQDPHISEYDTLTSEDRWNDYFDVILANPPFMSPKGGIRPHNRFSVQSKRSEVLFVDYIAEHLMPHGRAGVIVPEGIIFQSQNAYKQLREMLVKDYLIAVISLPAGVFNPYSGVKTSILLLDKRVNKKTDKILFVKIDNDGFDLGAQRRLIAKNDLPAAAALIKDYIHSFQYDRGDGHGDAPLRRRDAPWRVPTTGNALLVEKSRLGENGEFNLSGERYRVAKSSQNQFPIKKIGEFCETTSGGTPTKSKSEYYQNGNIPWLRSGEVAQGLITQADLFITELGLKNSSAKMLPINSVLVAMYGATAGQIGLLKIPACTNQAVCAIKPNNKFVPEYMFFILRHKKDELIRQSVGGAQPNISQTIIKNFAIPLPPLDIQREIVAEIDGYQRIIDGTRQVVENYKPRITIDPEWEMVELGEVCDINPSKAELSNVCGETEVSFIPMSDLNENQMHFEPMQKRKLSEVIKGYTYFKDNDVLLAKITPCFENGKAGIATNLINGIGFGSTEFIVFRAYANILPQWIYFFVSDDKFCEIGKRNMTGSAGQQRVPKQFVKKYQIPLPDMPMQEQLVAQLEREQALVNANKELLELYETKIKERIARVWGE